MIHAGHPIILIGAGGIVNDAHLPAYRIAGFLVHGIFDINQASAKATAATFGVGRVFETKTQFLQAAPEGVVFDVAVPGNAIMDILTCLPVGAAVLIQKPMGENFEQAKEILRVCREKKLLAAVNFQLRYAPFITAAREMIQEGRIGDLCDIEVNVNVYTPWHLWDFLFTSERVEILYHSIHYIDLIRSFLGNPSGVYAKTVRHPQMKELASVRSNIIMDYGDRVRANILTNHVHNFGLYNQQSYLKFEGTKGAIKVKLGALIDYPRGVADSFEYAIPEEGKDPIWQTAPITGTWFPHAFIGSMAEVMKAMDGLIARPDNSVEDCIYTMACVEAAYASDKKGGIDLQNFQI
jgi:predicted dehydrogenase